MEDTLRVAQQQPEKQYCPNKRNHVSAYPAFDRIRCPVCSLNSDYPVYVKKEAK